MGGSIQCDLSHATFHIDGNLVKVNREPKNVYMIEEEIEDDMKNFVDTDVNAFRAEVLVLKKDKHKSQLEVEANAKIEQGDLWSMFFDGACSKDGSSVGILLISPIGTTYNFSFTLCFPCTNNIAEYEALLLVFRLAYKYGIKCLQVVGDSNLIVSQVRNVYV